jgi:hypothetical protein
LDLELKQERPVLAMKRFDLGSFDMEHFPVSVAKQTSKRML